MPNICLTIAYDGTKYAGWQIQKNAGTIQCEIERALRKILNEKVRLIASGRTDAGVHARGQVANFKTNKHFPLARLQDALNARLSKDISIVKIKEAHASFHSQYSAKSKIYRYTILNNAIGDPLSRNYYWKIPHKLDFSLLKKEAKVLIGRHDFKSFQAKSGLSPIKNTRRTIKRLSVRKKGRFLHLDIEANGFLRNMARNIVGTLVEIARGRFPANSMKKILLSRDRRKAGPTAPAKGLMLLKVKYPPT